MPCFNGAAHLHSSVASALGQSFADMELIVVNDGSTDDSAAQLSTIHDPRLRVIDQPNCGVSAARNAGIAAARGEFIAFLDADDTWHPDCLRELHAAAVKSRATITYCGWQNLGLPGGRGQPYIPPDYEATGKLDRLFDNCGWPIHACLTRRDAVVGAGGFDTRFKTSEDWMLWLKIARNQPIHRVPKVLAYYHFHGSAQATNQRARVAINHFEAQRAFLQEHPEDAQRLAPSARKQATWGRLFERGLECHWKGDFQPARQIFRAAFEFGDRDPRHMKYLLPSLLPEPLHRALLWLAGRRREAAP